MNLIPILLSVCGALLGVLVAIAGYSSTKAITILEGIRKELKDGEVRMTRHEGRLDNLEDGVKTHDRRFAQHDRRLTKLEEKK